MCLYFSYLAIIVISLAITTFSLFLSYALYNVALFVTMPKKCYRQNVHTYSENLLNLHTDHNEDSHTQLSLACEWDTSSID